MVQPTGLNHVGLTVKDLDASLEWYGRIFGVQPDFVTEGEGAALGRAVGVPDARLRFAFVRVGQAYLELLEYRNERETTFTRRNCDVGSPHVCVDVEDIDASYRELLDKGVEFYSPPFDIVGGPLDGCRFVYFRDPDGMTLELFQHRRAEGSSQP